MLSYPGPVICTSLSLAPGTTLTTVTMTLLLLLLCYHQPLEGDHGLGELLDHVHAPPLQPHHLPAVSVPDDHLVLGYGY